MELLIEPGRAERNYWRDLWRYREVFSFLAWRDIFVRYKQTVIGISWALVPPLLTMVGLTFVFGWVAKSKAPGILVLPIFLALACSAALGPGRWLCALNVKYRDFRHVVPFIVQFGLYAPPVGFSSSVVPHKMLLVYSLNPMVGVIEGVWWSLLRGHAPLDWRVLTISAAVLSVLLVSGIWYFRKTERVFVDVI
jgi:ABC-type polysaccharide/polyol phosphate export permease